MFRRDVLATLLSMVSVSSLQPLLDEIEAATDGLHTDGGDTPDPNADGGGSDGSHTENGETDADGTANDDPGTRTAVVDRIENDVAVAIFDDGGSETVPAAVLPDAAREEGKVLDVPEGTSLALATVDHAATAERKQDAQDKFDELSEQPPTSDDANETASP